MAWQNNLRQIRIILYRLKRNFGLPITFWHPISNTSNIQTGAINRSYTVTQIKRGIVLPTRTIRDFTYDLSYIAANKNFTYGAYFDTDDRLIILDKKDLPDGFSVSNNDHMVFETEIYVVKEFAMSEHGQGYVIKGKMITSADNVTPAYAVSGDGSPRPNGDFYVNGIQGGQSSYQRADGRYWLWFSVTEWILSSVKGIIGTDFWSKGDATITGVYTANGTATGTPTVA